MEWVKNWPRVKGDQLSSVREAIGVITHEGRIAAVVVTQLVHDDDSPTGWGYDGYSWVVNDEGQLIEGDGGQYWGYLSADDPQLMRDIAGMSGHVTVVRRG